MMKSKVKRKEDNFAGGATPMEASKSDNGGKQAKKDPKNDLMARLAMG